MLDSFVVPAWIAKILRDIRATDFLHLCVVVLNASEAPPAQPVRRTFWQRLRRIKNLKTLREKLSPVLYTWYEQRDYRNYKAKMDPFEKVDVRDLLDSAETIRVVPFKKKFVDRFTPEDVARTRAADLDVLMRFGFRILKGEVLSCARYGVWSYHHDDNRSYRGGPALFWEVYEGNPVSGTILQVLSENLDGGKVIYRSLSATQPRSLVRNRSGTYWKTAAFMLRRLTDLHRDGWDYITSLDTYNEPDTHTRGIFRRPTNLQMVNFLTKIFVRRAYQGLLYRFFDDQWLLGVRRHSGGNLNPADLSGFRLIRPPRDRFWADPFLFQRGGRTYVFFEEYRQVAGKGVISCLELDRQGNWSQPEVVLERDFHLSYPFVFEWRGEVYMVPETGSNRTVELYRSTDFPRGWVLEKVLMPDVDARDATLFEDGDRWWMFVTMCVPGGPSTDELFIFHADSPLGPWQPHPRNPVVSDVRCGRPAGRLFRYQGALIRPGQDSTVCYGRAITLSRVEVLTETDYREVPAGTIEPRWAPGLLGTHTIDWNADFVVIDGKWLRFRYF